ncbi:SRPBCC family protein [Neolewinella persica]|uniref:SRPBCC family protein n=1 Tax=Neolewinella persica TaxID=70998 RepID=UPI000371F794|nr:SRPBCC family protein [Neolewinella persica]
MNSDQSNTISIAPLARSLPFSADVVWGEVRKMDNMEHLSSQIDTVEWFGPKGVSGEGLMRGGAHAFCERVTAFDDLQRSYSYEVAEGVPAKELTNTIRIIDEGYARCLLVWTSACGGFLPGAEMSEAEFAGFLSAARTEIVDTLHQIMG